MRLWIIEIAAVSEYAREPSKEQTLTRFSRLDAFPQNIEYDDVSNILENS